MDYTTSITWHTDFPKIGPGYRGAGHCLAIVALTNEWEGKKMPSTLILRHAFQEDDGTWGFIKNHSSEFCPFSKKYPSGFKIMAWGEFGLTGEAVDALCRESNRVNYGIEGKRDYALTELYLDRCND